MRTLSNLERFLSLELSTQSQAADIEVLLDTDDDEMLDRKDTSAEVELEKELEKLAKNDPEVMELVMGEFGLHCSFEVQSFHSERSS